MFPVVALMGFSPDIEALGQFRYLGNLIFLAVVASAICFATWNYAVKTVGAVKTSVYIYLTPIVTIVTSAIVLGEKITPLLILGTALTLAGLILSEAKNDKKR